MIDHLAADQLPLTHETDVLVVGGGPAGVAAALAAARHGSRVLVVEQFNCLGGVATAGGHGHICSYAERGTARRIVEGIGGEIADRVVAAGYGVRDAANFDFEVEALKLVLEAMMEEAGVNLLYHTFFCDTLVVDGKVRGAVIQNKGGRQLVRADRIVDATGDGDVAFHAGCDFEMGRPRDGRCQPVTLMFTIGGVDWDKVRPWRENYHMDHVWEEAQQAGDMRPFQKTIMGWWWTPTRPDWVGVNFTHIIYVDSTSAEDLTRATIEGRKQAYETIEVYRKYVPGMENCHMLSTPNTVGLRESRRIIGDYVLTIDDVRGQATFPDSIGYNSFFVDVHAIDGPGMDPTVWRPPNGFKYQIPWRIQLPRGIDNLLTAGRCVSCDHLALGSLRVMVPCFAMGEAAGTAAAMSLDRDVTPRELDVAALQQRLRAQGAVVEETDIGEPVA